MLQNYSDRKAEMYYKINYGYQKDESRNNINQELISTIFNKTLKEKIDNASNYLDSIVLLHNLSISRSGIATKRNNSLDKIVKSMDKNTKMMNISKVTTFKKHMITIPKPVIERASRTIDSKKSLSNSKNYSKSKNNTISEMKPSRMSSKKKGSSIKKDESRYEPCKTEGNEKSDNRMKITVSLNMIKPKNSIGYNNKQVSIGNVNINISNHYNINILNPKPLTKSNIIKTIKKPITTKSNFSILKERTTINKTIISKNNSVEKYSRNSNLNNYLKAKVNVATMSLNKATFSNYTIETIPTENNLSGNCKINPYMSTDSKNVKKNNIMRTSIFKPQITNKFKKPISIKLKK
jgi:hypothetical protein